MTPQARREEIVKILQEADSSGYRGELATLGVSRQVIVQDIALCGPAAWISWPPPGLLACSSCFLPSTGAHLQWSITTWPV